MRIAESPALEAFMRGLAGDTSLTPIQQAQFIFVCRSIFFFSENHFLQNRMGLLTRDAWETFVASVRSGMGGCGYRAAWKANSSLFSDEFRAFMDDMMRTTVPEPLGPTRLANVFQSVLVEELAAMPAAAAANLR